MPMNYIVLRNAQDLTHILDESFLLTGALHDHKCETEHNMWTLAFTDPNTLSITENDLITFFRLLHTRIQKQLNDSNSSFPVTLYLWFDEQAGQLRFNVISGHIEKLPFGCTVQKVSDPASIIETCLSSPYLHGISEDEAEDISFDEDRDDDDTIEYVLFVYVDYITP
jgi:hypothetical protein